MSACRGVEHQASTQRDAAQPSAPEVLARASACDASTYACPALLVWARCLPGLLPAVATTTGGFAQAYSATRGTSMHRP